MHIEHSSKPSDGTLTSILCVIMMIRPDHIDRSPQTEWRSLFCDQVCGPYVPWYGSPSKLSTENRNSSCQRHELGRFSLKYRLKSWCPWVKQTNHLLHSHLWDHHDRYSTYVTPTLYPIHGRPTEHCFVSQPITSFIVHICEVKSHQNKYMQGVVKFCGGLVKQVRNTTHSFKIILGNPLSPIRSLLREYVWWCLRFSPIDVPYGRAWVGLRQSIVRLPVSVVRHKTVKGGIHRVIGVAEL